MRLLGLLLAVISVGVAAQGVSEDTLDNTKEILSNQERIIELLTNQPPVQPPVEPPVEPPIEPPVEPPIEPPPPIKPPPFATNHCSESYKDDRPSIPDRGEVEPEIPSPPQNTAPYPDYIAAWIDDERTIAQCRLDSWADIWMSRSGSTRLGPHYYYDQTLDAMGVQWWPNTRSINPQHRINWGPVLNRLDDDPELLTVVVSMNYAHGESWGGKHFQYSREGELLYELQYGNFGSPRVPGYKTPHWRTYRSGSLRALEPTGSSNLNHNPSQGVTNFHPGSFRNQRTGYRGRKQYTTNEALLRQYHIHTTPEEPPNGWPEGFRENTRNFMMRQSNQWHTLIVTFDNRDQIHDTNNPDGQGSKICVWMASQGDELDNWPASPLTLLTGSPEREGDCFIHQMPNWLIPITSFWFEFNNSSTVATEYGVQFFRDVLVIRDVMGDEVWQKAVDDMGGWPNNGSQ